MMIADRGSCLADGWTYDVFLSFRGVDTRKTFTEHLYKALQWKGIRTFIDDDDDERLQRGQQGISQALINSIEESRIGLVVFSQNYACSNFCLDELVKIIECVKGKGRLVIPIFYDVDPSDVRYQRGSFGEALAKHMARSVYSREKLQKWSWALYEAATFAGSRVKHGDGYEPEFIQSIVEAISCKINRTPMRVANYPVGLESRLQELNSLLDVGSNCVRMIGIWGMGGIGKTTLARAVYNTVGDQFEALSFLHGVRENSIKHGLVHLQQRLLSDILGNNTINIKSDDVSKGVSLLKSSLCRKKVLVILDDVDHLEQLEATAGGSDWFGAGSRVIVTTRDEHVLGCHGVRIQFAVKGLDHQQALELFSWNAFKMPNVIDSNYADLVSRALFYAKGHPLALEVIGCNLFGKTLYEWKSELGKYVKNGSRKAIHEILRVRYEDLDQVEKAIFLDIACFLKGYRLEYVSNTLQRTRGLHPDSVIEELVGKSLIWVECGVLWMHDLVQDMGREIVLQRSRSGPFKVLRPIHMNFSCLLKENMGLDDVKLKSLKNLKEIGNARLPAFLEGLPYALRFLDRSEYLPCFPSYVHPVKVVKLYMASILDKLLKQFGYISCRDFKSCKFLRELPNPSGVPNIAELCLYYCKNMIEIQDPIGFLDKLRLGRLSFKGVTHLDLSACNLSDEFLVYLVCIPNLKNLNLRANNFTILPAFIGDCSHLIYLSVDDCQNLRDIEGIPPNIELFRAANCTSLTPISSNILLSQALHAAGNTQFILPGVRIPEWFDHFSRGGSVSFWVRKKFPDIAICFVLSHFHVRLGKFKLKLRMVINGKYELDFNYNYFLTLVTDHIMLFDLQSQIADIELDEILLDDEWNHVQLASVDEASIEGIIFEKEIIRCIGVYVYKPQSSLKDIRFTDPYSRKRKGNLFCCSDDFELSCYPLLKRQHKFLHMGAFKTCNIQQQINLGSVAQGVPSGRRTVFEDTGKYLSVYSDAGIKCDIEWLSLLPSMQPLESTNTILDPVVSKTMSDFSSKKDVNLSNSCNRRIHLGKSKHNSLSQDKPSPEVCFQSKQTHIEKSRTQVPEISGNLYSLSKEIDGDLFSMEHYMDHFDSSSSDNALEATDASVETETTTLSHLIDPETNTKPLNNKMTLVTKKALQILQDFVSQRFSHLFDGGQSEFLKTILEYLLSLSEDDGISLGMRSVILQLSRCFTQWSRDYTAASVKHELTTADLLKFDKLEVDIEANIKKLEAVNLMEDELCSRLTCLQERKSELEEHILGINEEIKEFRLPRGAVSESNR